MKFWDSSALVTLLVEQESSDVVRDLYTDDPQVLAWVLSDVEIKSALCRLGRQGALTPDHLHQAIGRLESFWESIHLVTAVEPVKTRAKRLLGVHPLRAAESLQLGAALTSAYDSPVGLELVCLDQRLFEAARREGFTVLP